MGDLRLLDAARKALRDPDSDVNGLAYVPVPEAPPGIAALDEYPVHAPRDVLPHPKSLACMVSWDTETSGLHPDDNARTAVVSVAFCRKETPDVVEGFAFPFDQGRAHDKGFTVQRDKRGIPKGLENPKEELPLWLEDLNLGEAEWNDLMRWLELAGEWCGLVGHNDKFDMMHTRTGTRHWPGKDLDRWVAWDTMLACPNLWPNHPIALKTVSARLWGAEEADEAQVVKDALATAKKLFGLTGDDATRYDLLPWRIIGPYAAQDAILTLRLAILQTDLFVEEGEGDYRDMIRQINLMRVLARMEWRGFGPLDVERTISVAEGIEKRIAQLEAMMPYQPPTAYRAKEYYFDQLGLRPWKGGEEPRVVEAATNKRGEPITKVVKQGTLTIDVLTRMANANVPFAAETAELSRIRTANTMQYRGYANLASPYDHRMRANFKQAFVRSGRMSVDRWQGQAIPRRDSIRLDKIAGMGAVPHPRDLFLVDSCNCDGCRGQQMRRVTLDLSQAELRVAFKMSGCKHGIEQIYDGRDIHGEMATQIFNVRKGVDDSFSHYRYIAKRGVFGGIFMVGPKTFRETIWKLAQIDLPWSEAQKTVYGFRKLYPEIEVAYNDAMEYVMRHGYVELADGTKSYFGPRDYDNTAWNRRVQGSLALFNAEWLIQVESMTADQHNGRGALVLSIHDSVTLDLEPESSDQVIADIRAWTDQHFEDTFHIIGATDLDEGF